MDKSRLIDDIIDRPGETSLYVRPRRFGKSLNLSMLDAYLNFRYAGNDWFDGLDISDIRRDDPLKNSFPVLHPANETHGSEDRQRITDFITDVLRDAFGDGNVQYGVAVGITQAFWEEAFGGT